MDENQKQFETLKELCEPIAGWLKEKYHPHTQVIIDCDRVRVVVDDMSVPLN